MQRRDETLPLDEARLLGRYRKYELEREQAKVLRKVLEETDEPLPPRGSPLTKPGDPAAMRGLPIVGRASLGGAIPGTKPHVHASLNGQRSSGRRKPPVPPKAACRCKAPIVERDPELGAVCAKCGLRR